MDGAPVTVRKSFRPANLSLLLHFQSLSSCLSLSEEERCTPFLGLSIRLVGPWCRLKVAWITPGNADGQWRRAHTGGPEI